MIILLAVFLAFAVSSAEARTWEKLGPPGGEIKQIVPDRNHPELWFAISTATLHRSQDFGNSWQPVLRNVTEVMVHPATSDVFVVRYDERGSRPELWISKDGGRLFNRRARLSFTLHRMVPDPSDSRILYAFGLDDWDLAVSKDSGRTWNNITSLPFRINQDYDEFGCYIADYDFNDFLVAPWNPNVLYATAEVTLGLRNCHGTDCDDCGSISASMVSNNGGKDWNLLRGPEDPAFSSFSSDPLLPDVVFATDSSGLYRINRQGMQLISPEMVSKITAVPGHPRELLGRLHGLMRSTNLGNSWKATSVNMDQITSFATLQDNRRGILGATPGGGIYRRDETQGWTPSNRGFPGAYLRDVTVPFAGNNVYAIGGVSWYDGNFFFASTDRGATWSDRTLRLPAKNGFGGLQAHPFNGKMVLQNAGNTVYLSRDGGANWSAVARGMYFRTYDPADPRIVFFTSGKKVYRSLDGGPNPRLLIELPDTYVGNVFVDPRNHQTVFYLTEHAIFRSDNGGRTAQKVTSGLPSCQTCYFYNSAMTNLPSSNGFLLKINRQIFRTYNAGSTWELLSRLPQRMAETHQIFAADTTGNRFYVSGGSFLAESTDGGKSWKDITRELGLNVAVQQITDPLRGPLFAATNRGLYRMTE